MPKKLMKAIPIRPVIINVMPMPRKGLGTTSTFSRSRIAAKQVMASSQPMPDPTPYTVDVQALANSRCCMKRTAPSIAQFTAIKGKKIPSEL